MFKSFPEEKWIMIDVNPTDPYRLRAGEDAVGKDMVWTEALEVIISSEGRSFEACYLGSVFNYDA